MLGDAILPVRIEAARGLAGATEGTLSAEDRTRFDKAIAEALPKAAKEMATAEGNLKGLQGPGGGEISSSASSGFSHFSFCALVPTRSSTSMLPVSGAEQFMVSEAIGFFASSTAI